MEEFEIKIWDGNEKVLEDYANLLSKVYQRDISPQHIIWKHNTSPMGPSLISYALNNQEEMVAARAFWPMYNEAAPLFQPCDTVTRPDFQRRGLFSKLTLACLDVVPDNSAIVNFPNHNSFPGYLKLGWKLLEENKKVFGIGAFAGASVENLRQALEDKVSADELEYLCWRFSKLSGRQYRFWLSAERLVVDNGQQSGAILLKEGRMPFGMAPLLSQGYVLPSYYNSLKGALSLSIAAKCQSRTAYFLKPQANLETIKKSAAKIQVNLMMDTF